MDKPLTLIYDGNNTAYRCNVVTELYTKKGVRTSATMGVLTSIRNNIEKLEEHTGNAVGEIIVVWDSCRADWRLKLYPEYKAGRNKDADDEEAQIWRTEFFEQINFLHENLHLLGVKSVRVKGWEADDVIYALTRLLPDHNKVIVSSDEDMLQMINQDLIVYSPIKDIVITGENFREIIGVDQPGFISYKLLKGDSSDNIRGIDGIGEVTGKDLINKYTDLTGVLQHQRDLMKSKRFAKIFTPEGLAILERNSKLMDLSHVDFAGIAKQLLQEVNVESVVDDKAVMLMLKELEMVSLLMDYKRWIQVYKGVCEYEI